MLEISSYNTYYSDIFCGSLNLRLHTADSSDNKLYLHACLRSIDKLVYKHLISERVNLNSDVCRFSCILIGNLLINHVNNLILQAFWGNKQMFYISVRNSLTSLKRHKHP